jgi:hypothetical protein
MPISVPFRDRVSIDAMIGAAIESFAPVVNDQIINTHAKHLRSMIAIGKMQVKDQDKGLEHVCGQHLALYESTTRPLPYRAMVPAPHPEPPHSTIERLRKTQRNCPERRLFDLSRCFLHMYLVNLPPTSGCASIKLSLLLRIQAPAAWRLSRFRVPQHS